MSLITDGQVVLDLTEPDRHAATRRLAQTLVDTGRCTDLEQFIQDVREREELMATGQPGGLAIPHARSAAITEPSLVFGRAGQGIDWGAKDGPASLIFLIAAPADGADRGCPFIRRARSRLPRSSAPRRRGRTRPKRGPWSLGRTR